MSLTHTFRKCGTWEVLKRYVCIYTRPQWLNPEIIWHIFSFRAYSLIVSLKYYWFWHIICVSYCKCIKLLKGHFVRHHYPKIFIWGIICIQSFVNCTLLIPPCPHSPFWFMSSMWGSFFAFSMCRDSATNLSRLYLIPFWIVSASSLQNHWWN